MGVIQSSINQAVKGASDIIKDKADVSLEKIKLTRKRLENRKNILSERIKGLQEKKQTNSQISIGGEVIKDPQLINKIKERIHEQ